MADDLLHRQERGVDGAVAHADAVQLAAVAVQADLRRRGDHVAGVDDVAHQLIRRRHLHGGGGDDRFQLFGPDGFLFGHALEFFVHLGVVLFGQVVPQHTDGGADGGRGVVRVEVDFRRGGDGRCTHLGGRAGDPANLLHGAFQLRDAQAARKAGVVAAVADDGGKRVEVGDLAVHGGFHQLRAGLDRQHGVGGCQPVRVAAHHAHAHRLRHFGLADGLRHERAEIVRKHDAFVVADGDGGRAGIHRGLHGLREVAVVGAGGVHGAELDVRTFFFGCRHDGADQVEHFGGLFVVPVLHPDGRYRQRHAHPRARRRFQCGGCGGDAFGRAAGFHRQYAALHKGSDRLHQQHIRPAVFNRRQFDHVRLQIAQQPCNPDFFLKAVRSFRAAQCPVRNLNRSHE